MFVCSYDETSEEQYEQPEKDIDYDGDLNPKEASLALEDILPINPKFYDKNRPPKNRRQPTVVYFHVTVLSLDSINEESMVGFGNLNRIKNLILMFRRLRRPTSLIYSSLKAGETNV